MAIIAKKIVQALGWFAIVVGWGLLAILGLFGILLFHAFLRAVSVRMMMGVWPHQSEEAMHIWKGLP